MLRPLTQRHRSCPERSSSPPSIPLGVRRTAKSIWPNSDAARRSRLTYRAETKNVAGTAHQCAQLTSACLLHLQLDAIAPHPDKLPVFSDWHPGPALLPLPPGAASIRSSAARYGGWRWSGARRSSQGGPADDHFTPAAREGAQNNSRWEGSPKSYFIRKRTVIQQALGIKNP
jgi:hypothetical protein